MRTIIAMDDKEIISYGNQLNEPSFWAKLRDNAADIGQEGVYLALILFYALKANIPVGVKLIIIGALCWLVSPVDAVPDFIPVVGYADDIAALMFARHKAEQYLDAGVQEKARDKLKEIKGVLK